MTRDEAKMTQHDLAALPQYKTISTALKSLPIGLTYMFALANFDKVSAPNVAQFNGNGADLIELCMERAFMILRDESNEFRAQMLTSIQTVLDNEKTLFLKEASATVN